MKRKYYSLLIASLLIINGCSMKSSDKQWKVCDKEYLEKQGLKVLVFHNFYPVGKQGGIEIIQHGERIATNGFVRMKQPVNGKRLTDPERAIRVIDTDKQTIRATVKNEDFNFSYSVRVWPEENYFRLAIDLDKPIPAELENNLNFELSFYPPLYYGKSYQLDQSFGIIARQGTGPLSRDTDGKLIAPDLAHGKVLTLAGEDPERRIIIEDMKGELVLYDERNISKQGWIMVRSKVPSGVTENAVEWTIKPNVIQGWTRKPMIAISQVGYHPDQKKQAIIELDKNDGKINKASLLKITGEERREVLSASPDEWGEFLTYNYAIFDFSSIKEPAMYMVSYGDQLSNPFSIDEDVYRQGIWQPALEAFFPIQMCHMEVRDEQAIWHGACHLDDALQAPLDIIHIDGYQQYKETETTYPSLTTVPYLNQGGWHDAGDDDLAAGSQAATTHYLVLADEICADKPDQTYINFEERSVEMYKPDGIPDFQQQIKAGALNLLSGYRAAGHSFAGIIANREGRNITGDWASQTDQLFYNAKFSDGQKTMTHSKVMDDRWVFTNKDTGLEYMVTAALAACSRSLKGYDDKLASESLATAKKTWDYETSHEKVVKPNAYNPSNTVVQEILATAELLYTTGESRYADHLVKLFPAIQKNMSGVAWGIARVSDQIKDVDFNNNFMKELKIYKTKLDSVLATNPFGIKWNPDIWGIGWDIQDFALKHYYLVKEYPELFDKELVYRVVNYVLGCHPGSSASLVSGVGAHSITNAFGVYRHMEYYIPGGMVSGVALIWPDFPELKETTPYLWQQSEYVMPGAASYIFCVLAAEKLLNAI